MIQRAEAQNYVVDVLCMNLVTGVGARPVLDGILLAHCMERIHWFDYKTIKMGKKAYINSYSAEESDYILCGSI